MDVGQRRAEGEVSRDDDGDENPALDRHVLVPLFEKPIVTDATHRELSQVKRCRMRTWSRRVQTRLVLPLFARQTCLMNRSSAPSLPELRLAWERYLLARVQVKELAGWGQSTLSLVQAQIAQYQELETAYLEARLSERRARNADRRDKT